MALLETSAISVSFGGLKAVNEVSLSVERGQIAGLIGPNGAGKTTFIDAVTGFVPAAGRITFDGRELSRMPAHERARAGLGRTWQSIDLFDDLSVIENLQVAAERQSTLSFLKDLVWPNRPRDSAAVASVLESLGLAALASRMPHELSHGQRKLVGVARALAARPKLVCLDEPAAGLDTAESDLFGERLRGVVEKGTTIFLVDHDMRLVLSVCDVIYVMEFGQLIAQGKPGDIRHDDRVIAAYLGERARGQKAGAAPQAAAAEEAC